jgi:hypothetical protein
VPSLRVIELLLDHDERARLELAACVQGLTVRQLLARRLGCRVRAGGAK